MSGEYEKNSKTKIINILSTTVFLLESMFTNRQISYGKHLFYRESFAYFKSNRKIEFRIFNYIFLN